LEDRVAPAPPGNHHLTGDDIVTALPPEKPITRADIEAKLGELKEVVDTEVANARGIAIGVGVTVLVVLVLATFFLGRRRGRKLATIVEIRRV
jgi:hypothetical protein